MSKTIVELFSSMEEAESVKRDLIREGYPADSVNVVAKRAEPAGEGAPTQHSGHSNRFSESLSNFFRSLTGGNSDEEHYYTQGIDNGRVLVSVTVPDDQLEAAKAVLERHGATDLDQPSADMTGNFSGRANTGERSIPVVQEELQVGKRQVQRGGVRVYSHVTERPVEEKIHLREERVTVERHPVNRPATEDDFRAFADRTIEMTETSEEPVISKKARVVEEVVVGKDVSDRTETVRDKVRQTEVEVENLGG